MRNMHGLTLSTLLQQRHAGAGPAPSICSELKTLNARILSMPGRPVEVLLNTVDCDLKLQVIPLLAP